MTRRVLFLSAPFLLVPLLAVVLVGFARGQGADEHQGDAGANPQPAKAEVPYLHTYVLDDWEHGVGGDAEKNPEISIWQALDLHAHYNKGLWDGDPAEIAPCVADGFVKVAERFGIGYYQPSSQVPRLWSRGGDYKVIQFEHYIHLHVFGDHNDTVVLTGLSKSLLHVKGEMSSGPRLYSFVFVKQHGRWLIVAEMTSDIPKGNAPWDTW